MLAEASTTEISKKKRPVGLESNKQIAREGGTVARKARLEIERQTGGSIITDGNPKTTPNLLNPNRRKRIVHKPSSKIV